MLGGHGVDLGVAESLELQEGGAGQQGLLAALHIHTVDDLPDQLLNKKQYTLLGAVISMPSTSRI